MLKAIFDWFKKPSPAAQAPAVQPEAVPYKTEAPAQVAPVIEAAPVVAAPADVGKPADDRVEATARPARKPRAKPAAKPAAGPATKPAAITAAKKPQGRKPAQK
jgi:hypothetical protein